MIYSITSTLPSFKSFSFKQGLNVILADRVPGATDRQTRNGAGKSSFVELIHFLLGADANPESIFRTAELAPATFVMTLGIGGRLVTVQRSGLKPSKVIVEELPPESGNAGTAATSTMLGNEAWKAELGQRIFGLTGDRADGTREPSFRSLFPYFARRVKAGGFNTPFAHAGQQQRGDQQVALMYLLGLDWTVAARWQSVRDQERALRELKKAAKDGLFGEVIGTAADLRTQLTVTEERAARLQNALRSFRVHEQYHEIEQEASRLSRQLAELVDANTLDEQYLSELEDSRVEETAPNKKDLAALYAQVGIELPAAVLRRFEDVEKFHASVVRNRRSYLLSEIAAAHDRIRTRSAEVESLDGRRSHLMSTLSTHGALEHFAQLQSECSRLQASVETTRQRFNSARALESGKLELDIERQRLYEMLKRDFEEQEEALKRAILVFEDISHSLYEETGSLTISETLDGPSLAIKIHGQESKGIGNMQIFCFDLTLMQLCSEREVGPGFLIHDSHLFDGVDERQVANALRTGASMASKLGFQYIVTMNSDAVPSSFPPDFNFGECVLQPTLTDATEDGGLFGLRFK